MYVSKYITLEKQQKHVDEIMKMYENEKIYYVDIFVFSLSKDKMPNTYNVE